MNKFPPLLLLMVLGTSLLAQSVDSNAVTQKRYAVGTLRKYCTGVQILSDSRRPRIFAQVSSDLEGSSGWAEFESKATWRRAGKPKPLALVWYSDSNVVRVAISGWDEHSFAEYCYRPDGSLAQFRSVPVAQTNCDEFLFHCDVKFRGGGLWLYPPNGPVVHWVLNDSPLFRPLKPERTIETFAPWDWPEYLSVSDLPFNRLLYLPTKMTK